MLVTYSWKLTSKDSQKSCCSHHCEKKSRLYYSKILTIEMAFFKQVFNSFWIITFRSLYSIHHKARKRKKGNQKRHCTHVGYLKQTCFFSGWPKRKAGWRPFREDIKQFHFHFIISLLPIAVHSVFQLAFTWLADFLFAFNK